MTLEEKLNAAIQRVNEIDTIVVTMPIPNGPYSLEGIELRKLLLEKRLLFSTIAELKAGIVKSKPIVDMQMYRQLKLLARSYL